MTFHRSILGLGFLWVALAAQAAAYADGPLDPASEESLGKTRQMLTIPAQREQVIQSDARARQADSQVDALTSGSPQLKQQVYDAAAGAISDLTHANSGDPEAMLETHEKAQQDPEGFLKSLSPETQQQIKSLARDIEEQQKQQRQPH